MRESILVQSKTIEDKILSSCHSLIAAFFPGKKIQAKPELTDEGHSIKLRIEYSQGDQSTFKFQMYRVNEQESTTEEIHITSSLANLAIPGKESLFQIQLKQAVIKFLGNHTGQAVPWGILTGIRPGKLIKIMEEQEINGNTQTKVLKELYLVREDKAALLQTVNKVQKPFLQAMSSQNDVAALYVSIPFCPSRCYYCSFPSNNPEDSLLAKYLSIVQEEIKIAAETLTELGFIVNTIYIGGGTPTVLEPTELGNLLKTIREFIPIVQDLEYTVEAGRPETIDSNKLLTLQEYGVNRISINPQSMQVTTLQRIGRKHTITDIYKAYELARKIGDWDINMDLILGLPGEGFDEISDTLERILTLCPDNITVHSLARKRRSSAWMDDYNPGEVNYWLDIQKYVHKSIETQGFIPYYLYRQKYIIGNLENIGYALPNKECLYNIAIIEEKQNIFGIGAGAATKILNLKDQNHKNIYQSVDLIHYMRNYKNIYSKIRQALEE